MEIKHIRKSLLQSFIGFLILTALIAIATVISGEVGEIQARILGTTLTISVASICGMSCAAFIEKRRFKSAGMAGMIFSFLSAILVIIQIWATIPGNLFFKIAATCVVSALTFAHSLLLFLPTLDEGKSWVQTAAAVTDAVLALQVILLLWFPVFDHSIYFRVMTIVAIIVGLETLIIPILMKLSKGDEKKKLILERVDEGLYEDTEGRLYEVKEKIRQEPGSSIV